MSKFKPIISIHRAIRDDIGNLITRRPLPQNGLDRIGAFLFLNHHGPQTYQPSNDGLPFGPHPHRGFETVTFILEGSLAHSDSSGHESVIHAGGVQWMTAGSGLIHSEISPEDFKRHGGPLELLQLWVNLPARLKMTQPRYIGLQADRIPAIARDGNRVVIHLVSGEFGGHNGPINSLTGVFMSTIDLMLGGHVGFGGLKSRDVFLYVVRGDLMVNGVNVLPHDLVQLGTGDQVEMEALTSAQVLFGHADPINETVVSHGPFVMNSASEIQQAYADYRAGRLAVCETATEEVEPRQLPSPL
jgi:hypothetical protein